MAALPLERNENLKQYSEIAMSHVTVGQENSATINLYYENLGIGQPIVLIHRAKSRAISVDMAQSGCRKPC